MHGHMNFKRLVTPRKGFFCTPIVNLI